MTSDIIKMIESDIDAAAIAAIQLAGCLFLVYWRGFF
jgi:hypothetical protein